MIAQVSFAETASDRAKMYFEDLQQGKYKVAASHFDPSQLKEFRQMMEFYKALPEEHSKRFVQTFFGENQSVDKVAKLSDAEFFAGMLTFIMRQAQAAGGVDFNGFQVLGEVPEGEVIHLVTRNQVSVGHISTEAMEVVSLKKNGDEWRMLMSGKVKGLPNQIKAAFS